MSYKVVERKTLKLLPKLIKVNSLTFKNKNFRATCRFQCTSCGMSTDNFLPINLECAISIFGILQEECY